MGGLADITVHVNYADSVLAKKIRAWARRNGATAKLEAYTRGAYEGTVVIHSPWDEGIDVALSKAAKLRELIGVKP